jgi:hypothetical protein
MQTEDSFERTAIARNQFILQLNHHRKHKLNLTVLKRVENFSPAGYKQE